MANEACVGFGNTGYYTTCDALFKVLRGMFLMNTRDSDGNLNKVPAGTIIDDTFISGKVNETDKTKRWYPIMGIENATGVRAEPVFYENESGAKEFVKQGARDLSFELRRRGSEYLGQILSCPCDELSVFFIDGDGKLRGKITAVGSASDFYPIRIQPASQYATIVFSTPDNPEHLMVQFQHALTERDELLRTYPAGLIEAELLDAKGLVDVYASFSDILTTSFTADLTTIYTEGDLYRPTGLLVGDFTLYDETAAAAVVITSVTETTPGVYDFVIPSTALINVKRLTPTKIGYDFSAVVATTFTDGL